MILSHLPIQTLKAYIKTYDIILNTKSKDSENIIKFREECLNELKKKYDLYKKE